MTEIPTVSVDDPFPAEGEFYISRDGKSVAGVVLHPRMEGFWMAVYPPANRRDSGMKRYKTRRGAVGRVQAALSSGQ